jgi:hypothetical protein
MTDTDVKITTQVVITHREKHPPLLSLLIHLSPGQILLLFAIRFIMHIVLKIIKSKLRSRKLPSAFGSIGLSLKFFSQFNVQRKNLVL